MNAWDVATHECLFLKCSLGLLVITADGLDSLLSQDGRFARVVSSSRDVESRINVDFRGFAFHEIQFVL